MGYLLHRQLSLQDLLQAWLSKSLQEYYPSFDRRQRRYAATFSFPKVAASNLQLLPWCPVFPRGELRAGRKAFDRGFQCLPQGCDAEQRVGFVSYSAN